MNFFKLSKDFVDTLYITKKAKNAASCVLQNLIKKYKPFVKKSFLPKVVFGYQTKSFSDTKYQIFLQKVVFVTKNFIYQTFSCIFRDYIH